MTERVLRITYHDRQLRQWARDQPERAERVVRKFLPKAGQIVVRRMQLSTRVFRRPTGQLKGSIRAFLTPRPSVVIGPHKVYAAAVDTGSRPHVIRARNAPRLVFMWNGRLMRVKEVHHPGFRGHQYVQATLKVSYPRLVRLMQNLTQKELNRGVA